MFEPTSAKGNRWPPHRTPIRIKVPFNVSKSPLLNCLYGVQLLKADYFGLGHAETATAGARRRWLREAKGQGDVATSVLIGLTSSRSATAGESEPELQRVCITESEASERPASSLANTFGVGRIGWLDRGFIKVKLAHVKKKRQSERYANQKRADNRDPKSPHTEAASLCKNEDPEHQ